MTKPNFAASILTAMLVAASFCSSTAGQDRTETVAGESLFDGKTLDGWKGDDSFWSVVDGAITGETTPKNPTPKNTFLIWEKGELADFELTLKFRIIGGNSGIQYRSKDQGDFVVGGYQADIDATNRYMGILYEERGRGILAQRTQSVTIGEDGKKTTGEPTCDEDAMLESLNKEGWNEYRIVAEGNRIQQFINGYKTIELTDNQSERSSSSGILALQLHQGPPMVVQFKDIVLVRK